MMKTVFCCQSQRRWDCWLPEASQASLHVGVKSAMAISHPDENVNALSIMACRMDAEQIHYAWHYIDTCPLRLHSWAVIHNQDFKSIMSYLWAILVQCNDIISVLGRTDTCTGCLVRFWSTIVLPPHSHAGLCSHRSDLAWAYLCLQRAPLSSLTYGVCPVPLGIAILSFLHPVRALFRSHLISIIKSRVTDFSGVQITTKLSQCALCME